ncbi:AAA family ATPase [uncultured Adlercreutzia sp.]|uniref:AAA family ATPase n=1 Tax=uncultured Adlercreutzia sp. TaxID=875803 RepID=UPI0026F386D6|nr:AAA family ATPase [uncultured Adlercreutzia sp.]
MTNRQLVESAGFYGKDFATGKTGFNLAAVVTLGKDEVIRSLCPTYKTDALVRVEDTERYDDRLTVATNLLDAYQLLAEFGRKHLPDRFLLSGDFATSPRDVIIRELVVNCLIHREFTSPFVAKMIVDRKALRTENASRASFEGPLDPDSFNPLPKNPLIASFFSYVGLAEELGSGTRELFRNSRLYTGRDPELEEGVIFRATVPLEAPSTMEYHVISLPDNIETAALQLAAREEGLRTSDLVEAGHSRRTAQRAIRDLVDAGKLAPEGNGPSRVYRA